MVNIRFNEMQIMRMIVIKLLQNYGKGDFKGAGFFLLS
jgi:hypothetical protein